jgi:hypothetical protein
MTRFVVKAALSVDVEISIEAEDADQAKKIFHDSIMITASLSDIPETSFDVYEDGVSDVDRIHVEKEK